MSEPDFVEQELEPELEPGLEPEFEELEEWDGRSDPGAGVDVEGIPEVADESTPGTGDVPEPEVPVTPNDAPVAAESYGTTAWEQGHPEGVEERVAEEMPEGDLEDDRLDGRAPENAALRVEDDGPGPEDGP